MAGRKSQRILLVDSDELLLDLLQITLQGAGYMVDVAHDGRQAIQALQEREPDLIILELMLPVMDGLSFLRQLREQAQAQMPIMALTALDRPGIDAEVAALGVAELVYKPLGREELLSLVTILLREKPPARTTATG